MAIIVSSSAQTSQSLYNAILNDVYSITARPDLVAETAIAIRKATMKAHSADFWINDLVIVYPPVTPTLADGSYTYRYSFDLSDVFQFPRVRKVDVIKEYNNPLTGYELQFKQKESDAVLDEYLLESVNYWYQAGNQIQLRSNKSLAGVQINYWQYPNVIPVTYASWIAQQFPDMIVEEAAAQLYRVIGKLEEAAYLAQQFSQNLQMLQMAQII